MQKYIRNSDNAEFIAEKDKSGDLIVECRFIVFNERGNLGETEMGVKVYEEIAPEAIDLEENLNNRDVAVLWNHDSSKILARTNNGTLILVKDDEGVKGIFKINPEDSEAVNCYEKIKSGLVYQNSFGFYADEDDIEIVRNDDGSITQRVKKLDLIEVSPCTFPVYQGTSAQARGIEKVSLKVRKQELKDKIRSIIEKK